MVDRLICFAGRGYGGREAAFLPAGEGLQQVSGRAVATRSRRAVALAAAGECALAAPGRDAGARAGALPQQWALMSAPSPGARLAASSEQRCWLTVDAQGQRVACCNTQEASCPQNAGPRGKSSRAVPRLRQSDLVYYPDILWECAAPKWL